MGLGGWLEQLRIRLSQPPTKLKLKLKLSLAKRSGHFVRKTENVLDFSVSKSVDKFLKQMNQKSFLCLAEIKSIYKCYILTFSKKKTCKVSWKSCRLEGVCNNVGLDLFRCWDLAWAWPKYVLPLIFFLADTIHAKILVPRHKGLWKAIIILSWQTFS